MNSWERVRQSGTLYLFVNYIYIFIYLHWASLVAQMVKNCLRCRRLGFDPWVGKIPWRRAWQPTSVFLPGESHGQRSLVGYSPCRCKEPDTTERLSFISLLFPALGLHCGMRALGCSLWTSLLLPCMGSVVAACRRLWLCHVAF